MNVERMPATAMTYPGWLRLWCPATAAAMFALITLGTLVTTFRAGMADPIWPTSPWHLLVVGWTEPNAGYLVEHAHRIAGYLVGMLVLVQTLVVWWYCPDAKRRLGAHVSVAAIAVGTGLGMWFVKHATERSLATLVNPGFGLAMAGALGFIALAGRDLASRSAGRWQRTLVTLAYVGIVTQGMLGGLRVYLNELRGPELSIIHGIFAQVVFGATCLLAVMVGKRWNTLGDATIDASVRWWALAAALFASTQIAFGGLLRHVHHPLAQRLHPLLAFAVLAAAVVVTVRCCLGGNNAALRGKALGLVMTIGVQVILGVEAWLRTMRESARFESVTIGDAAIRSLHVLVGFGVFSSAALLAARAWKAKLI